MATSLTPEQASLEAANDADRRQKLMSMGIDPDKDPATVQQRARDALGLPPPVLPPAPPPLGDPGYGAEVLPGTPEYMQPIPPKAPIQAIDGRGTSPIVTKAAKKLGVTLKGKKEAPKPAEEPAAEPITDLASEGRSLGLNLTEENTKALTGKKVAEPGVYAKDLPYTQRSIDIATEGRERQAAAQKEELQNQAGASTERYNAHDQYGRDMQALQAKAQASEAQFQKEQQEQEAKMNMLQEERKNFKMNPSRIFKSENALQLAMIGLSTALGFASNTFQKNAAIQALALNPNNPVLAAQLQQLNAEKNPGLEALDKAINMDIAAQKEQYEKIKDSEEAEKNIYGMMLKRYGSKKDAEAAMRGFYQDSLELKMQEIADRTQNKTFLNNAKDLSGKFQAEQAQWNMQMLEKPAYDKRQRDADAAVAARQAEAKLQYQMRKDAAEHDLKLLDITSRLEGVRIKAGGGASAAEKGYSEALGGIVHGATDAETDRIKITSAAAAMMPQINDKIINILDNNKVLTPTIIGQLEALYGQKSKLVAYARQHGQQTKDELWLDIGEKPYSVNKETGETSFATTNFLPGKLIAQLKGSNREAHSVLKTMQQAGNVSPAKKVQNYDGSWSYVPVKEPLADPTFDDNREDE